MRDTPKYDGLFVLAGSMVLMCVMGSVHAFSVFLQPLEIRFDATRLDVSLTYSFALVCLTTSVLFGHHVFRRCSPVPLAFCLCIIAAAGGVIAAYASSLQMVWLGYSVLFGGANGLAYALSLQCSAQSNPDWKGTAMGLVTASYAVGAIIGPVPFQALVDSYGVPGAMVGLATVLGIIAPIVTGLLWKGKAVLVVADRNAADTIGSDWKLLLTLWIGYGTAVAAGLMTIGHATGVAHSAYLGDGLVLLAPIVIAGFNMAGSLLGGWLADRLSVRSVLMMFPALSAIALFLLAVSDSGVGVMAGLAVVGFSYGAIIAVYPAAVSSMFGAVTGVRAYGYVFTAWGTAGLLAPALAGYLYEKFGDYEISLLVAGVSGLVSLATVWFMPLRTGRPHLN